MANWYAVYTRPRCEKKVVEILTRKNIKSYCPLVKSLRKLNDSRKSLMEPLFPTYVYVKMNENDLHKLKNINRIISVVYWLQQPVMIRDIEIEMIQRFINEHKNIQIEKTEVKINEIVRLLREEPIVEKEGNSVSIVYNKVKLVLPSLGYSMIAIIENENVKVITSTNSFKSVNEF